MNTITELNGAKLKLHTGEYDDKIGYNIFDTNIALETSIREYNKNNPSSKPVSFVDTLTLLKKDQLENGQDYISLKEEIDMSDIMLKSIQTSNVIIMGETFFQFDGDTARYDHLVSILKTFEKTAEVYGEDYNRLIIPLTLNFPNKEKETHITCLCIDKKGDDRNIFMLEQHSGAEYTEDKNVDYSEEKKKILNFAKNTYVINNINSNTNCYTNNSPYCTEKRVCGICTSAIIDRLMDENFRIKINNDDSINTDNLQVTKKDIDKTYEKDVKNAKKYITNLQAQSLKNISAQTIR